MAERWDIVVAGGGAAGLAAAYTAARAGARVLVLERDVAPARKILATGNGRCNLANEHLAAEKYRHPAFAAAVLGAAPEAEVAALWQGLGLATVNVGGWVYPRSKRASSVRNVLLAGCERAGVRIACGQEVVGLESDAARGCWLVRARGPERLLRRRAGETERKYRRRVAELPQREGRFLARAVVMATGGGAELWAEAAGLPFIEESPVLCPVACADPAGLLARADGVRAEGSLELRRAGACVAAERGEALFRRYGISGICAFNLSRRCRAGDELALDLFPEYEVSELAGFLRARAAALGAPEGPRWFDGLVAPELADALWGCGGLKALTAGANRADAAGQDARAGCAADDDCSVESGRADAGSPYDALARALKHVAFTVTGLAETETAQVTRGGLACAAFDAATLEARERPGLYAVGEALDMDADCGGFNLAWAWITGMRAGEAAAASVR